jgi:hypothetical protein
MGMNEEKREEDLTQRRKDAEKKKRMSLFRAIFESKKGCV